MVGTKISELPAPATLPIPRNALFPVVYGGQNYKARLDASDLRLSIAAFGAAQDGVTDDTNALRAALTAGGNFCTIWIPWTATGTKILGAAGANGVVVMKAGQHIESNGATIITGAGPAIRNVFSDNPTEYAASGPWLQGLRFVPALPATTNYSYVTGSTAIVIGTANQSINYCRFSNYDKPITYVADCYWMEHVNCEFSHNHYGFFWPQLSNAGATMDFLRAGFDHNVIDIHIDSVNGKFLFDRGFCSLPQTRYVELLGAASSDAQNYITFRDFHFETDVATSGVAAINTDAFTGTHCMSVSGVGANAKMADDIIVPAGTSNVSICFMVKNVAGVNPAFPQATAAPITGGAHVGVQFTRQVQASWTNWEETVIQVPMSRIMGSSNLLTNGCRLNLYLPSADTDGGEIRYDDFYVDFF